MSETTLHVWRVDSGGERFWIIAADEVDAIAALHEAGMVDEDSYPCECDVVDKLDPALELTVHNDDGGEPTRKTCAEWIAAEGRGYLAGTAY